MCCPEHTLLMLTHFIMEEKMIYTGTYESPLGRITLSASETALTGLWFDGQKYFGSTLPSQYGERPLPVLEEAKRWLDIYFQGKEPDFMPPLELGAASFRRDVWEILRSVPYGQTITYGRIAAQIARQRGLPSMSAQAVGGAVGHNPISLLIPCHRVVGSNGSLTGYAGGIGRKVKLLELEGADVSAFRIPERGTVL